MSNFHKEPIYAGLKRGIYLPIRYPWGSTKGADGRPTNANGIITSHYNFYTFAGVSALALPRSETRRFCQIQNLSGANDISFAWDTTASLTDGVVLTPGQVEIFDVACPVGQLNIFCVAAFQRVAILEGF